jgi:hypothetical protein
VGQDHAAWVTDGPPGVCDACQVTISRQDAVGTAADPAGGPSWLWLCERDQHVRRRALGDPGGHAPA